MGSDARFITIFLLLIFAFLIGKPESDCLFEHLSTSDGLSHGSVSGMLKDKRGFMWFSTWDGINRYDGTAFKIFKTNSTGVQNSNSNRVEDMLEDLLGNIWIITYDFKAYRLNQQTEQFEAMPGEQYPIEGVTGIYPQPSGVVWVTSRHSGAFCVIADSISNAPSVFHFNTKSSVSLPGNSVGFIVEDDLGFTWINTNSGLICLKQDDNSGTFKLVELNSDVQSVFNKHQVANCFVAGKRMFFGTSDGYLLVLNDDRSMLNETELGEHVSVSDLTGDLNNLVFAGTSGHGVFEYNIGDAKIIRHLNSALVQNVLNQFVDSHQNLWVETTEAGISKVNLKTGEVKHFEQELDVNSDMRPNAQCGFLKDENGVVWLTLKGGGFGYYNSITDEVEYFYNEPGNESSRASNFVNCFYKDSSGVLWMSTYFKGIEKVTFINKKFNFKQPAPKSQYSIANEVRAMLVDSHGRLWLATKKEELFVFDQNNRLLKKFDKMNGEFIGRVYALLEDSKGKIYLGTKGNGLFVLTPKGEMNFSSEHFTSNASNANSLSSNNIYDLMEDRSGRIWIATYGGGINLFENDQFYHSGNRFRNFPMSQASRVRCFDQDNDGNIWMGTTNGIAFLSGNQLKSVNPEFEYYASETAKGLQSNDILWILHDSSNTIWMASLGGGLARYEGGIQTDTLHFTTITKNDGLPSDVIFTITEDAAGRLWMSTENGISSYNPTNKNIRNYSRGDGLLTSGFSEAAVCTAADGTIFMGAYNGYFSFDPSKFESNQRKVDVEFTSFKLFGKEVEPGSESVLGRSVSYTQKLKLAYNQSAIGFSWAGLDYTLTDKMQFACKLDGFDENWQFLGNSNSVSYTKIPPGKYTFMVRFTNPELQELNSIKTIEVEILPPFWKSTWAYILYLILSIVVVEIARRIFTSMIRLQNRVVIERELANIKLNFFTNVSHELRTPLSLILGPVKELLSKEKLSDKGQQYAEMIEQNTDRLLRLVNQLLDFRKVQSKKMKLEKKQVNINRFVQLVAANFSELALEKNINFCIECPSEEYHIELDENKIDSVLFNLLSNAFKFTPVGGKIDLIAKTMKDSLNILVKDNGCGISVEQEKNLFNVFSSSSNENNPTGVGIGLALSKQLVELHDGELLFSRLKNGGSQFSVRLPGNAKPVVHLNEVLYEEPFETETAIREENSIETTGLPLILVIEDNADLRKFLQLQLGEFYRVEEAVNGKEGWEKATTLQPDIILSDIMMPEMDGIQLLDKVKNTFETSHIPVVLLTAKSSVESKVEGLKYGADAYITKPFHSDQLLAQLENLLEQRSRLMEIFANGEIISASNVSCDVTTGDAEFLNRVRKIIEENLSNSELKIADVYKEVGMGRSKFFDKMKGLTGLSPVDFIRDYRLRRGKQLLQSGKYNVSETSYMTGFTDAGYFSKCYKEKYGISPSHELENH